MIRVDCPAPSDGVAKLLAGRRRRGTLWTSRSRGRQRRQEDIEINNTLRDAFHGKCGYCESIEAETIDHFWPQDSNIDKIWDWDNYIWSCSVCQQRKSNRSPESPEHHRMVNPREDEPLHYLRIEPLTGKIFAIPTGDATELRGVHTISILGLDQRSDLDKRRQLLHELVVYLLYRIVDPQASQEKIVEAWRLMQEFLDDRQPYLASIQQLFTIPSPDVEPLVQLLFEIIPEAGAFLERFQRPIQL